MSENEELLDSIPKQGLAAGASESLGRTLGCAVGLLLSVVVSLVGLWAQLRLAAWFGWLP